MRARFTVYGSTPAELRDQAAEKAREFFGSDPFEIEPIAAEAMMSIAGTILYWKARVVAWDKEVE